MGATPLRVLVVDDHAALREGLVLLLCQESDVAVVGQAADGAEAVEAAARLAPDVVLMDLHMPGCSGVQACRRLRQVLPSARVVIMTASVDEGDRADSINAGAAGFVTKSADIEELVGVVRAAGHDAST